jgi:prepilin-type processing-associated H-X9-DG protein
MRRQYDAIESGKRGRAYRIRGVGGNVEFEVYHDQHTAPILATRYSDGVRIERHSGSEAQFVFLDGQRVRLTHAHIETEKPYFAPVVLIAKPTNAKLTRLHRATYKELSQGQRSSPNQTSPDRTTVAR